MADQGPPLIPELGAGEGLPGGFPPGTEPLHVTAIDIKCADKPTNVQAIGPLLESEFRDLYCFFKQFMGNHWYTALIAGIAMAPVVAAAILSQLIVVLIPLFVPPMVELMVKGFDAVRKATDQQAAELGVDVLNELLGTSYKHDQIARGGGVDAHIARAQQVGAMLHDTLRREFAGMTNLTPESGKAAAEKFSGFLINFGTATGFLGLTGELASVGLIGEFREIGEQVARNLGLGRLHRMALRPLIEVLLGDRYKEYLHKTFTPTQFTVPEVLNPFSGAVMDEQIIFDTLTLQGYSEKKIRALIALHQKKLTETDVELLVRYGAWPRDVGEGYLAKLGYPKSLTGTVLQVLELRRADARLSALVSELETNVKDGHLTLDELTNVLRGLPLGDVERAFIQSTAAYKLRSPHKSITLAEMQTAFDNGLADLGDLQAFLVRQGYSLDDQAILTHLTLLKLAKITDTAKAKAERQAAAKDRAAAAKVKATRGKKPPA